MKIEITKDFLKDLKDKNFRSLGVRPNNGINPVIDLFFKNNKVITYNLDRGNCLNYSELQFWQVDQSELQAFLHIAKNNDKLEISLDFYQHAYYVDKNQPNSINDNLSSCYCYFTVVKKTKSIKILINSLTASKNSTNFKKG